MPNEELPIALRMATSLVLWVTIKATRPYKPRQEIKIQITAKILNTFIELI